eukprot:g1795.t1
MLQGKTDLFDINMYFIHRVTSMSLKTGIVGLPNVGKSTLFNAIVEGGKAQAANFPFCTIDPNIGIVSVPDKRLHQLSTISNSKSTVPTAIEFVDIAGLVKGASQGEGLGNKFLSNIRQVDAIVQVVRCFDDEDVVHVDGNIDSLTDTEVINLELALSDISQIEKRLLKLNKNRGKSKEEMAANEVEKEALEKIMKELESGISARSVSLNDAELDAVRGLDLLTMKPMIYAANVNEDDLANNGSTNNNVKQLASKATEEGAEVVVISAKVESELSELAPDDALEFLQSLGAEEGGLKSLVKSTYRLLDLRTYFTSGEKETRAWTIKAGTLAPQAAGVIHSDFEKGFIRAETVAYDDFVKSGGFKACQSEGTLRLEGRDYIVQEGDVILFRFNV